MENYQCNKFRDIPAYSVVFRDIPGFHNTPNLFFIIIIIIIIKTLLCSLNRDFQHWFTKNKCCSIYKF
jgi:hypothetical protein